MQLDLVDLLRCPAPHDEMPLVCVARSTTGRELRDATLGCPTCHAEFPVRDGVAWLGIHVALVAMALLLAKHNKLALIKKW